MAERRRRRLLPTGLNPRQEKVLDWVLRALVLGLTAGWTLGVIDVYGQQPGPGPGPGPAPARAVGSALLDPRARSTAYLKDSALHFLQPLKGHSGALRAVFRRPGEALARLKPDDPEVVARLEHEGGGVTASEDFSAPADPGVYRLAVELEKTTQAVDDLSLVTLVPFERKRQGKIGLYYLGSWPYEGGGKPRSPAYANPEGFVEVTPQNRATQVSEHFQLQDFLTKDQFDVWPKYVLIDSRLLDKLELVIQDLEGRGHHVRHVQVMSGFRTPRYNVSGGNTAGRANLSRHIYGDAADVFVDNDRDGNMDDLTGDGRVTLADAEVIARAADRVERRYPALVGGVGLYPACCGHGPFVHVDVRGHRARWRGEGTG